MAATVVIRKAVPEAAQGAAHFAVRKAAQEAGAQSRSGRENQSSEAMRVEPIWGRRLDRGVRKEDSKNGHRHKQSR